MIMNPKDTKFIITLSSRIDRMYAVTMKNKDIVILDKDDEMDGNIVDLLQGAMGYFEEHGFKNDDLIQLMTSNVLLSFDIEDMLPHDPMLKHMAEGFGLRAIYYNGIK